MKPDQNKKVNDKPKLRLVTAIGLAIVIFLYALMRNGLLGEKLQGIASIYLSIMLVIFGARAIVTEIGIRR